jgi:CRISPR/Cas system-associated endonuclease Cas1
VNATLNYAYAVLESQMRIATVAQGLDPTIGYLHACRPGRVALVYDLMEPLRPWADRLVLDFVYCHTFSPSDFILREDEASIREGTVHGDTPPSQCGQKCIDLGRVSIPPNEPMPRYNY